MKEGYKRKENSDSRGLGALELPLLTVQPLFFLPCAVALMKCLVCAKKAYRGLYSNVFILMQNMIFTRDFHARTSTANSPYPLCFAYLIRWSYKDPPLMGALFSSTIKRYNLQSPGYISWLKTPYADAKSSGQNGPVPSQAYSHQKIRGLHDPDINEHNKKPSKLVHSIWQIFRVFF